MVSQQPLPWARPIASGRHAKDNMNSDLHCCGFLTRPEVWSRGLLWQSDYFYLRRII